MWTITNKTAKAFDLQSVLLMCAMNALKRGPYVSTRTMTVGYTSSNQDGGSGIRAGRRMLLQLEKPF